MLNTLDTEMKLLVFFISCLGVLILNLEVLLVPSLSRFFSAWNVVRHCFDSFSSFSCSCCCFGLMTAHAHAEFWRETVPLVFELLLLITSQRCRIV